MEESGISEVSQFIESTGAVAQDTIDAALPLDATTTAMDTADAADLEVLLLSGGPLRAVEALQDTRSAVFARLVAAVASSDPAAVAAPALRTLSTILGNIVAAPRDDKFRRVRTSSRAYQSKVAAAEGAEELLLALGFVLAPRGVQSTGSSWSCRAP